MLQEKKFEPVGSTTTLDTDARVLLATNQSLEALIEAGAFREDLYYRINVVQIDLPPLRERPGDIALLVRRFLDTSRDDTGKLVTGIDDEAMQALTAYRCPGIVRVLQNIIERAVVLTQAQTITAADLPEHVLTGRTEPRTASAGQQLTASEGAAWTAQPLAELMREPERVIIMRALAANDWNRQKTADDLAINRTTLYKKMRQLDIDPEKLAG